MFTLLGKTFAKVVEWLDFPPPKSAPGTLDVHWEFMGDLLGELTSLSDTETAEFLQRDFSKPANISELTKQWILPSWGRFTPSSRDKIIHTLDYFLTTGNEKINWIFPSFCIPINTPAHPFFSAIRKELTEQPFPDTTTLTRYRENGRTAFANTLFSVRPGWEDTNTSLQPLPVRHGLNLPRDMERHAKTQTLESLKRWATTGTTPDGITGTPCDAARWNKGTDTNAIHAIAAARFAEQKHDRLGVNRITIIFAHTVGEGYLAYQPDILVTTRKVRCIIDRLGFLVRCYPVLRR